MMCGIIIVRVDQPISFAWIWIPNIGQLFMCVLFQFSLFYRLEGTWLWDYFDKTFTHVQVKTGQFIICTTLHANKINARDIMFIIVFKFLVLIAVYFGLCLCLILQMLKFKILYERSIYFVYIIKHSVERVKSFDESIPRAFWLQNLKKDTKGCKNDTRNKTTLWIK